MFGLPACILDREWKFGVPRHVSTLVQYHYSVFCTCTGYFVYQGLMMQRNVWPGGADRGLGTALVALSVPGMVSFDRRITPVSPLEREHPE